VSYGHFDPNQNKRIHGKSIDRACVNPKKDRIIMSRANSPEHVGASAYIDRDYPNLFLSDKHWQFIPKENIPLSMKWLSLVLTSKQYRRKLSSVATGTSMSMKNIPKEKVLSLSIKIPQYEKQIAIVSILAPWDSAIEKTERLIELKEQQFAHLLHHLIVTPSAHWHGATLNSVIEPVSRKNTIGETTVLTSSAELGLISQLEYYKKSVSAEDLSGYYLIERGVFAYNRSSAKGYPYGVIKRLDRYERGVLSTLYLCFRIRHGSALDSDFLAFYFESGALNPQLAEVCQEGARSHGLLNITKSDFFDLIIYLPDLIEQKRISKVLSLARIELENLRELLDLLEQQKTFLMSKLLTGEWEAPDLGAKGK
jgi:type I restriction enzyme S subunit